MTTKPTPLEREDELRKKVQRIVKEPALYPKSGGKGYKAATPVSDEIMEIIRTYTATKEREAEERTTRRIEHETHTRAFEKMREELERASHPTLRVVRKEKDYLVAEMIEEVKYGGDVIIVTLNAKEKDV